MNWRTRIANMLMMPFFFRPVTMEDNDTSPEALERMKEYGPTTLRFLKLALEMLESDNKDMMAIELIRHAIRMAEGD